MKGATQAMSKYRAIGAVEEEHLRNLPEEVNDYIAVLSEIIGRSRNEGNSWQSKNRSRATQGC